MDIKDQGLEMQRQRREAWVTTWALTASAANCTKPDQATKYADKMLEEYDKRFNSTESQSR